MAMANIETYRKLCRLKKETLEKTTNNEKAAIDSHIVLGHSDITPRLQEASSKKLDLAKLSIKSCKTQPRIKQN